jgi:hypothetical protein
MKTTLVTACNRLARRIREEYRLVVVRREKGGWRLVGARFGVSGAMAFRIAKRGYIPKSHAVLSALHLPETLPAPVCPKHGVVHTGRCPRAHKSPEALEAYRAKCEINQRRAYVLRYNG